MTVLWFVLVALMLATYVVLDGFDLGAGSIHPFVCRDQAERNRVLRTIGPVWDGNEVWLIATGGVLFFAFPVLYAVSFSGFYLPLILVLWLLMARGLAIELRGHVDHPLWRQFWDGGFFLGSGLLSLFLGVALGNVLRGVPLDATGYFFEPLWTDGSPRSAHPGILDWFTVLVGLQAVAVLAGHGANWVALKTDRELAARCVRVSFGALVSTVVLTVATTWALFALKPGLWSAYRERPYGLLFPLLAGSGLGVWAIGTRQDRFERQRFTGSTLYLLGMLASCAFVLYPVVLPAVDPRFGLTAAMAATSRYGMQVGTVWFAIGMAMAAVYFVTIYRLFRGKVAP
ncbi:MAG: cytochrome d ubiquinol oxidase subunit II [Cyanobacteria bacterium REEB65]|nr:cytochrome d ubiquinol oxidase subunit II [Cyanobacteria bacterium REEB65]